MKNLVIWHYESFGMHFIDILDREIVSQVGVLKCFFIYLAMLSFLQRLKEAMEELQSVHLYAAGALFALALHQAQIQQFSLVYHPAELLIETDSEDTNYAAEMDHLWVSQKLGLLRPIFRFRTFFHSHL